jgi:hypothetical protein
MSPTALGPAYGGHCAAVRVAGAALNEARQAIPPPLRQGLTAVEVHFLNDLAVLDGVEGVLVQFHGLT